MYFAVLAWKLVGKVRILFDTKKSAANSFVLMVQDGDPPLSFDHELETHPKVQLDAAALVVSTFGLTPTSPIQRWDAQEGSWSACTLQTVFMVDTSNRLPLRLPPNLLYQWKDCPGLTEELQQQSRKPKRSRPSLVSPVKVQRGRRGTHDHLNHSEDHIPELSEDEDRPLTVQTAPQALSRPTARLSKRAVSPQAPQPSAQPTKSRRWPTDYHVVEIADGLKKMRKLSNSSAKSLTQADAYARTFGGCFVRNTFFVNRRLFSEASEALKDRFIAYGKSKKGLWPHFARLAKAGRTTVSESDNYDSEDSVNEGRNPLLCSITVTLTPY